MYTKDEHGELYDLGAHILDALHRRQPVHNAAPHRKRKRPNELPVISGIFWHSGVWFARVGAAQKRFGSTVDDFWKAVAWKEGHE